MLEQQLQNWLKIVAITVLVDRIDFYILARLFSTLLSGVNFDIISPAKNTLKKVFFAADL
ncbi:MAG: hypothetical protein LBC39_05695 [Methanobrevibacter sp.]|jgi:hypothetical protein|nr:hypothetical protein [Candidatus Methanovirga aequatorialis]